MLPERTRLDVEDETNGGEEEIRRPVLLYKVSFGKLVRGGGAFQ